jgi:predicted PurR-regulated permease PerM
MSIKLPSVTSPPWSPTVKRIVVLALAAITLLVARNIDGSAWATIIIAVVLAYLLSPVVAFFERRLGKLPYYGLRRTLSVLLTWVLLVAGLAFIIGLIVPATVRQARQLGDDLPGMLEDAEKTLKTRLSKPITIGDYVLVPWDELEKAFASKKDGQTSGGSKLADALQGAVLSLANPAINLVGGAVSLVVGLVLELVMLFYLMRDGPLFARYIVDAVPESYRGDVLRLMHELGLIWNAYLRGQLLLNLAVGAATYIAALILGLPQPLVLGLLAGFLEMIPNLGPLLSAIPAVLFALVTPSSTIPALHAGLLYAVIVELAYIAIQQLEAIFLVPRILGSSLDLHPFVVLVAILIGASLAGILGVILAAPSAATLRLFGRYLRGKLLDEDPFPALAAYGARQRGMVYRLMHFFLSKRFPVMSAEEYWA